MPLDNSLTRADIVDKEHEVHGMTATELRLLRILLDVPQARIAAESGLDKARLCRFEKGKVVLRDDELVRLKSAIIRSAGV